MIRDHFVYAPSQWEMALHCNTVSRWLGAYTEWSIKDMNKNSRTESQHNHTKLAVCLFLGMFYTCTLLFPGGQMLVLRASYNHIRRLLYCFTVSKGVGSLQHRSLFLNHGYCRYYKSIYLNFQITTGELSCDDTSSITTWYTSGKRCFGILWSIENRENWLSRLDPRMTDHLPCGYETGHATEVAGEQICIPQAC